MNKNKEEITALVYCRVSSERQKTEGHGLESQEHRSKAFARSKGLVVEKVFPDSFTGGGDFMKRPAMAEMLAYIDSKPHRKFVVIFDDISRLARDVSEHIKLRAAFRYREVELLCLNYNFDETPEGEFSEIIMAANAELFRKTNRRQVIQKQRARLERGYWPFYPPPGYIQIKDALHGKLLTPSEPIASVVKEALEGFASGRFENQVDVQRFLQKKDFFFKNKSVSSSKVHLEKVRRLLSRVIYTGYIEYPDWEVGRIKGHHEALISLQTYEKIQERLNGKVKVYDRQDIREDFPVRGFVVCKSCSKLYTASWTTKKKGTYKIGYYRCTSGECVFKNKSISAVALHKDFESLLRKVAPKPELAEYTLAIVLEVWNRKIQQLDLQVKVVEKELVQTREDISSLTTRLLKTENETLIGAYETQLIELAKREALLNEKFEHPQTEKVDFGTAAKKVFDFIESPYYEWVNGDIQRKRLVLKLVFSESLAYHKSMGFGTPKLVGALKVFEEITHSKSQDVEMGGVEPPCNRVAT
jgi:site-specific DNA recombinase